MLASSGYVAQIDESVCVGCAECLESCQFGALSMGDQRSRVDFEKCMGCGVCAEHCPTEAISLKREPAKGEPLEILALMEKAAG